MLARLHPCKMLNFYGFRTVHNNATKFTFIDHNSFRTDKEYALLSNFNQ